MTQLLLALASAYAVMLAASLFQLGTGAPPRVEGASERAWRAFYSAAWLIAIVVFLVKEV